jgi:ribosomal protein L29
LFALFHFSFQSLLVVSHFSRLRSEISDLKTQIATGSRDPVTQQLATEFAELQTQLSNLKTEIATGLRNPVTQELSTEFAELRTQLSSLKTQIAGTPTPAPIAPPTQRPS